MAYDDVIASASKQYGVEPALIKGVIATESSWKPNVIGDDGKSFGLMQVQLTTAREVAVNPALTSRQLLDPTVNVLIGTKYLADRLRRFGMPAGIAAYNSGTPYYIRPGVFVNNAYVNRVLANRDVYRGTATAMTWLPLVVGIGAIGFVTFGRR